ncbi:MAG TPA: YbhB/YbcL family Raf kinase inhibitor-like protein [Candidatus Baltobacteraceae bacterium]
MRLESETLNDGGTVPQSMVFDGMGCTGANRSPHLRWDDVPPGTKSFALVMHDPDAPTSGGFYHWVLLNVPGNARELAEGAGASDGAAAGTHGRSDFGTQAYGGPCPPPGPAHRYHITLHALDVDHLPLDAQTSGAKLEFTALEHTLATARLTGLFGRAA